LNLYIDSGNWLKIDYGDLKIDFLPPFRKVDGLKDNCGTIGGEVSKERNFVHDEINEKKGL